ncbi:MAG: response regulator transcription factor [Chloroflexi bacterium]|nr:response regulator transcription factor [Chloroflexota bacterium]
MIVDDHKVVREGLSVILQLEEDMEVVAEAGDAHEALERAQALRPDVVLMDVRLEHDSGIETCREIKALLPETKVLMLTSYSDEEAIFSSLMAGASGYLLKNTGKAELLGAIRAVGRGDALLDPTVTRKVIERVQQIPAWQREGQGEALSERELEVLALVTRGLTNKEIAERLYLSDHTVRNHVSRILQKLGLSRRSEAVAFALRNKLVGTE